MRSKSYLKKNGKGLTVLKMSSLLATASILTCDITYGLSQSALQNYMPSGNSSHSLSTSVLNSANDNTYTPNYNQYLNHTLNDNTSIQNQSQNYLNNIKTPASTAQQAGNNLYNSSIQGSLGSKGAIHQNISTPMNGGSQLHTFNNVESNQGSNSIVLTNGTPYLNNMHHQGNIQMYCPSSATAIEIMVSPNDNGYYTAFIEQSTQLNGTYDNQFGITLSGVCQNGIITCNPPNAWGNNICQFYTWVANSNGAVSLVPATLPSGSAQSSSCQVSPNGDVYQSASCYQLQNCICTEASCNVTGTSPAQDIASILAGGIEQAVITKNTSLLLSKGSFDPTTLTMTVMGQSKSNCNFSNYKQYSGLPSRPSQDATQQLESQELQNPESPYSVVMESYTVSWNGQQVNSANFENCTISNSVQAQTSGGQTSFQLVTNNTCSNEKCDMKEETICDDNGGCVTTYQHGFATGNKPVPTCYSLYSGGNQYQVCTDGNQITVQNSVGQIVDTFTGKPNDMWFQISRSYVCSNNHTSQLGNLNTVTTAVESASLNGNTMNYQYESPNGQTSNQSAQIPQSPSNTCPAEMCIVQYTETRSDRFGNGTNRSQIPAGDTSVGVQKTLVCQLQNGTYVCPAPPGSSTLQPCLCENTLKSNTGFDEAITMMDIADRFAKQFYCTQTPSQTPNQSGLPFFHPSSQNPQGSSPNNPNTPFHLP